MKDLEHATIPALARCSRPQEPFDDADESRAEAAVCVVDQLAVGERLRSMMTPLAYEEF
jgi:hypothetical protein